MNEAIRKEMEAQQHYEQLMQRYYRIKNLPFELLKLAIFEALHIDKIYNFMIKQLSKIIKE